jgi:hypothetical protein
MKKLVHWLVFIAVVLTVVSLFTGTFSLPDSPIHEAGSR